MPKFFSSQMSAVDVCCLSPFSPRESLLGSCIFVCMSVNICFAHNSMQVRPPQVFIFYLCNVRVLFLWEIIEFLFWWNAVSFVTNRMCFNVFLFFQGTFLFLFIPKINSFICLSLRLRFLSSRVYALLQLDTCSSFKCEPEIICPFIDDLILLKATVAV